MLLLSAELAESTSPIPTTTITPPTNHSMAPDCHRGSPCSTTTTMHTNSSSYNTFAMDRVVVPSSSSSSFFSGPHRLLAVRVSSSTESPQESLLDMEAAIFGSQSMDSASASTTVNSSSSSSASRTTVTQSIPSSTVAAPNSMILVDDPHQQQQHAMGALGSSTSLVHQFRAVSHNQLLYKPSQQSYWTRPGLLELVLQQQENDASVVSMNLYNMTYWETVLVPILHTALYQIIVANSAAAVGTTPSTGGVAPLVLTTEPESSSSMSFSSSSLPATTIHAAIRSVADRVMFCLPTGSLSVGTGGVAGVGGMVRILCISERCVYRWVDQCLTCLRSRIHG